MRFVPVLCILVLSACSSAPTKVVTEVKTVEVSVPVRVPCIAAADVPARPARLLRADADIRGLAAGAAAELRAWEVYGARADAVMRGCL